MSHGTRRAKDKKNKNRVLAKERGMFSSIQHSYKKSTVQEPSPQGTLI